MAEHDAWRSMDDCPSDGRKVWVYGGRFREPRLIMGDGEWWRSNPEIAPTMWAPCDPPPLPPAVPAGWTIVEA